MADERIVYGAGCFWWDSVHAAGSRPSSLASPGGQSFGLPCCPHCGSVLMEVDDEAAWWKRIDAAEREHPGYRALCEWSRGRCFPSRQAAQAAMDAEVGVRSQPVPTAAELEALVGGGTPGRELRGAGTLNMEYEDVPGGPIDTTMDAMVVSGCTYLALVVDVAGQKRAAVGFRFVTPDGRSLAPVVLVVEDDELLGFPDAIRKVIRAARREVGRG